VGERFERHPPHHLGSRESGRPTQVSLQSHAIQLDDGSIDVNTEAVGDRPGIAIDEVRDGKIWERLNVTVEGARALAQALLELADEVEGWSKR